MKLLNIEGKEIGNLKLPSIFNEEIRPDIIKRAVLAIQSHRRQPYGNYPLAGKDVSAKLRRRRRKYRGSYGMGISRVPRKIMNRRGRRMSWVGALAPHTVGGRRAHPPKAEKIWEEKINRKERRKAIRSAIAATIMPELVSGRGHHVPPIYPVALENRVEELKKTKEVVGMFKKVGLEKELERSHERKIRVGKGKMRGRKYKKKKGPLVVVSKRCNLIMAGVNITGVDVVEVNKLDAELLAPGAMPGRLTIWTENAIRRMEEEKLFTNHVVLKGTKEKTQ